MELQSAWPILPGLMPSQPTTLIHHLMFNPDRKPEGGPEGEKEEETPREIYSLSVGRHIASLQRLIETHLGPGYQQAAKQKKGGKPKTKQHQQQVQNQIPHQLMPLKLR